MIASHRAVLISALAILLNATGQGQESPGFQFMASSGFAFPASPMTFVEHWTMRAGGSAAVGYPLSSTATLVGSVEYYRFELDVEGVRARFNTDRLRRTWVLDAVALEPSADPSSMLTVALGLRIKPWRPDASVEPYVLAGGGWMRFSLDEVRLPTTSQLTAGATVISMTAEQAIVGSIESAAFMQSGLGVVVPLTETFQSFVEARYVLGFTRGARSAYVPLTVGVILQW